jgi:hypothetical protein
MGHDNQEILTQFKQDKPKKRVWGNYRIEGTRLVYKTSTLKEVREYSGINEVRISQIKNILESYELAKGFEKAKVISSIKKKDYVYFKYHKPEENVIAQKLVRDGKTIFLGNASILDLIGRTVAYGNENRNRVETDIQRQMRSSGFVMIPFSVFDEAGLDLTEFKEIDKGPEKSVVVKEQRHGGYPDYKTYTERVTRHFTGASLFSVESKLFLFDIDQREIEHGIFNPFLVELTDNKITTIKDAYESLKPKAVKDALKRGLNVKRQGEWFFIPSKAPKIRKLSDKEKLLLMVSVSSEWGARGLLPQKEIRRLMKGRTKLLNSIARQGQLRAGQNRPNTVQMLKQEGKTIYCKGKVSHSGREHADLILSDWHVAVPNTSTRSFTITGDID